MTDMPWCPKCKVEYREGFTVCSDCGSDLVNVGEFEEKDRAVYGNGSMDKRTECQDELSESLNEPVLLMQAADEFEANNIIALLAGEGIPAYLSHKGSGQYLSITVGMSNLGVNIFVPKSALQQAQEITKSARSEYSGDSRDDIADGVIDDVTEEINDGQTDSIIDREENQVEYKEGERLENTTRVTFARILLVFFLLPIAYTLVTYLIRAIQSLFR
jgi:hypothetical protein